MLIEIVTSVLVICGMLLSVT